MQIGNYQVSRTYSSGIHWIMAAEFSKILISKWKNFILIGIWIQEELFISGNIYESHLKMAVVKQKVILT